MRSMSVDVLEDDDGVVHDASHGDRKAAQGHDVERQAGDLHQHQRGQDRERDADRGDQRRAEAEQEQEDRDDREERAQAALAQQAVLRLVDEVGQVLDGRHVQVAGMGRRRIAERLLDGLRDLHGVGDGRLGHVSVSEGLPSVRE